MKRFISRYKKALIGEEPVIPFHPRLTMPLITGRFSRLVGQQLGLEQKATLSDKVMVIEKREEAHQPLQLRGLVHSP